MKPRKVRHSEEELELLLILANYEDRPRAQEIRSKLTAGELRLRKSLNLRDRLVYLVLLLLTLAFVGAAVALLAGVVKNLLIWVW